MVEGADEGEVVDLRLPSPRIGEDVVGFAPFGRRIAVGERTALIAGGEDRHLAARGEASLRPDLDGASASVDEVQERLRGVRPSLQTGQGHGPTGVCVEEGIRCVELVSACCDHECVVGAVEYALPRSAPQQEGEAVVAGQARRVRFSEVCEAPAPATIGEHTSARVMLVHGTPGWSAARRARVGGFDLIRCCGIIRCRDLIRCLGIIRCRDLFRDPDRIGISAPRI